MRVAAARARRRAQGARPGGAERGSSAYGWPGNVRELVNLCRRLSVLAPGQRGARVEDLPPELRTAPPAAPTRPTGPQALAGWAERARA